MIWEARKQNNRKRDREIDQDDDKRSISRIERDQKNTPDNKHTISGDNTNSNEKGSRNGKRFGSNAYSSKRKKNVCVY